jgi:hypothetical protein
LEGKSNFKAQVHLPQMLKILKDQRSEKWMKNGRKMMERKKKP